MGHESIPPASPGTIDTTALEQLREVGGSEFLCELIDMFLVDAQELVARARAAADAGQLEDVFQAAHQLKSISMTLGAVLVHQLAGRTESAARSGAREEIACLLPALVAALDEALAGLRREKARASGSI